MKVKIAQEQKDAEVAGPVDAATDQTTHVPTLTQFQNGRSQIFETLLRSSGAILRQNVTFVQFLELSESGQLMHIGHGHFFQNLDGRPDREVWQRS